MLAYILRLHVLQLLIKNKFDENLNREIELYVVCIVLHCAYTLSCYLLCISDFIVSFANFVRKGKD